MFELFNVMLFIFAIIVLLSFSISFVGYKYDVIVREQDSYDPSEDLHVFANIQLRQSINSSVFKLEPENCELHKALVQKEYIVELKDYDPHKEKCAIRIIRPMNIKIPEGMHFNIIDNDKIIGTGKTSI